MSLINELTGNRLRIIKFLYRHKKGSSFATRGNIATRFYVSSRFPDSTSHPDEDIDFLVGKGLVEREERNLLLTDLAVNLLTDYETTETNSILSDIVNVDYEFALLKYLDWRNEFVNADECPKILQDFAPFLNNFNLPSGMLIDNLFKLKNYLEEKNHWYRLNDFGKQYLNIRTSKIKKEKRKKKLEDTILRNTVSSTRFQRNVTSVSLLIALVAGLIPLFIYLADRDKKVKLDNTPEIQKLLETQQALQKSIQEIQRTYQAKDTSATKHE